jgi:hypothetical protein
VHFETFHFILKKPPFAKAMGAVTHSPENSKKQPCFQGEDYKWTARPFRIDEVNKPIESLYAEGFRPKNNRSYGFVKAV